MLNKFTCRSKESELLDSSDILPDLLHRNLKELDTLNSRTGGYLISLNGMKQLITDHDKIYNIVDLGCGSGKILQKIADWARLNNYKVSLVGVDMNPDAIGFLKLNSIHYPEISGFIGDYQSYLNQNSDIDVVHCSLFCHHLTDNRLMQLFDYFRENVKTGFIINDLHRHWFGYYGAWIITRLLNGTELAKNDGPVSVLRGFKFLELRYLLNKANIRDYSITQKWLFRFLIVGKS